MSRCGFLLLWSLLFRCIYASDSAPDDTVGAPTSDSVPVEESETPLLDALLALPPPIIYRNGPGLCATNKVVCKEIWRVDWCIHFCLWTFDGYLMLNMSFTIWMFSTEKKAFELGEMIDDPQATSNPPLITADWGYRSPTAPNTTANLPIKIEHFKYHRNGREAPHYFAFRFPPGLDGRWFNGNIQNYLPTKNRFELYLYRQESNDEPGSRDIWSLRGEMDAEGNMIEWGNTDIHGNEITNGTARQMMQWMNHKFDYPKEKQPRKRGCYLFGPLNPKETGLIEEKCGEPPTVGTFDGRTHTWSAEDHESFERDFTEGKSACPMCDAKNAHQTYHNCAQRYESAKQESTRCSDFADKVQEFPTGDFGDSIKAMCTARLQFCVEFNSVTFTDTQITICAAPKINILNEDGSINKMNFPGANPVPFGCIDMRVTNGMKSKFNKRVKAQFMTPEGPPDVDWKVEAWAKGKIVLFTVLGAWFAWFLLRSPSDQDDLLTEEFDDAKFFSEYGEFYTTTETDDKEEEENYDEIF